MNTSLFSLALISTVSLATALAEPPGSTEDADRRFLQNLEDSQKAKGTAVEPAARSKSPVVSEPVVKKSASANKVSSKDQISERTKTKAPEQNTARSTSDVTEEAVVPAPPPKRVKTYVKSPPREVTPQAAAPTPTIGLTGRQRAPLSQDVIVGRDSEPAAPAPRIISRSAAPDRLSPPVVVAPEEPTVVTSPSTTVTIVRTVRPERHRDYDRHDEHGFFHRLFHHGEPEE